MNLERLRNEKKKRKLTNKKLSELSGVPVGTLNKIFAGQTPNPQYGTLRAICGVLGMEMSELENTTLAAHHDGEWTEEELRDIEKFKEFLKNKREV